LTDAGSQWTQRSSDSYLLPTVRPPKPELFPYQYGFREDDRGLLNFCEFR